MSTQEPFSRGGKRFRGGLPAGDVVATFDSYEQAQRAVDRLANASFPVARAAIVGSDIRTVEDITGRRSYGRSALGGSLVGAWFGLLLGLVIVLVSPQAASLPLLAAAILIGAGFGMLFRIVTYSVTKRRRDYTSVTRVVAASYSIVVSSDLAPEARRALDADH